MRPRTQEEYGLVIRGQRTTSQRPSGLQAKDQPSAENKLSPDTRSQTCR